MHLFRAVAAIVTICAAALSAHAQIASLSKGQQILVDRGMQITGVVALTSDPFHLSTLQSTNFTAPLWAWTSDVSKLGAAPGAPWAKWFDYTTQNDLTAAESPYRSSLVQLYVGDEQYLNTPSIFADTVSWFNANRSKFPTTILLTNQWGTEVFESTMIDFVSQANPDAVSFDNYPYVAGGGSYIAEQYADLSKYRRLGLGSYIGASGNAPRPYGLVIQTYQSTGDGRRATSDSEMRRDLFAGWTAGYTFASAFTYNSGASTLFTGGGDNTITTLGTQFKESARQSRNLAPTLVKLISKGAAPRFIAGQESSGAVHDVPSGWASWSTGAEDDPYTTSITVANTGTKNSGHPGDVLIGYFNPMLDSYDGPAFTSELYLMITNALADPTGAVADCKQDITLDFNFTASGINSLQRLRRSDGQVEIVPLTHISGNHYQLTLSLDGGTGDLFKFNDGAPFVGATSPALVYWDSDTSAANNNSTTGAGTGGNGTWNGANSAWYNGSSNSAWSAGKHAIFWGTAGTVTLASPQSASSIAFLTNGYTLTGSTLTMSGAAIMADTGVTANVASAVAGTLGIMKNGRGTVNLTAANTYSGGTTINAGVLGIASASSLGALPASPTANIAINNGATLRFNGNGIVVDANRQILLGPGGGTIDTNFNNGIAGAISGSTLTKTGTGTLTLSAINSHAATVLNSGALNVSSDANLGLAPTAFTAGNITLNGGTLQFGGDFDLNNNRGITLGANGGTIDTQNFTNASGYTQNEGIQGNGNLTKLGSGTFFMNTPAGQLNNNWKGNLILKEGTWKITERGGLPYNANTDLVYRPGQITFDGGTLQIAATISTTSNYRGITISSDGGTFDTQSFNFTWGGPVIGSSVSANFNKIGSGTLTFTTATASGTGPGTYSGNLNINGGTVVLNGGGAWGDSSAINLANASGVNLTIGGAETIGSLAGGGTSGGSVTLSSTLVTGGNNNSTTFSGVISGSGGLTKTGTGTFTLARAAGNTYSGNTTLNAGTLLVNNSTGSATGSGSVLIQTGAMLGGTGKVTGPVTINNGGHIAPGASIESLDVGSLSLALGCILDFELDTLLGVDTSDLLNVNTTNGLTINGGTLNLTNLGSMTFGTYTLIGYTGTLNGSFGNLALGSVPAGFSYSLVHNTTNKSIDLFVSPLGDFNHDGAVDAGDYVVWRKNPGNIYAPEDYTNWRAHFGQTAGSGAGANANAAVPEPATLVMLLMGMLASCSSRIAKVS